METINLLRKLSTITKTRRIASSYLEKEINIFKDTPKFLLPLDGVVLNVGDDLKKITDYMTLPFPRFVIEYQLTIEKDLIDVLEMTGVSIPDRYKDRTEIISSAMLFVEQLDNVFSVRCVTFIKGDENKDNDLWEIPSFKSFVDNAIDKSDSNETGLRVSFDDESKEFKESPAFDTFKENPLTFGEIFKLVYLQHVMTVIELSVALECKNITHSPLPERKLNKSAKKKGALPFDVYRVLTVNPYGKEKSTPSVQFTDRNQPREHLRRGHIRRLHNGNKVYVSPTVVNPGIGGKITKDYLIK